MVLTLACVASVSKWLTRSAKNALGVVVYLEDLLLLRGGGKEVLLLLLEIG